MPTGHMICYLPYLKLNGTYLPFFNFEIVDPPEHRSDEGTGSRHETSSSEMDRGSWRADRRALRENLVRAFQTRNPKNRILHCIYQRATDGSIESKMYEFFFLLVGMSVGECVTLDNGSGKFGDKVRGRI